MNRIRFRLSISAETYKRYYSGEVRYVLARSYDGRRVKFPASYLRRFVSHEGITGEFEIEYDGNNRLKEIRRIS
ncbi:MAG: DUF2835 domain-containing protein [Deltaproteobacteria bacterium]|nr:DUF2835 domain-containing protein [Deltaproteobacteria bacterium]